MITKEKREEVLCYLRNNGKTYDRLLIWEDETQAEIDGYDAMVEVHVKTKQIVVVTNIGIATFNYKERGVLGGMYDNPIYYVLI